MYEVSVALQKTKANVLCLLSLSSSDKPATPTVTADSATPTDGDNVVLTCTTTTVGITAYLFKKGVNTLANSASSTYTISAAAIDANDGTYTCIAYVETVASDESATYSVSCESVLLTLHPASKQTDRRTK